MAGQHAELGNLIERLSILHAGRVVQPGDLPVRYRPADWSADEHDLDLVKDLSDAEAIALLESGPMAPGLLGDLPEQGIDLKAHLHAIEHGFIRQALERSGGTVAHAARLLGLRRTTLVEKLRKFGFAAEATTET